MAKITLYCGGRIVNVTLPSHVRLHEWPMGEPGGDVMNVYARSFAHLRTQRIKGQIKLKVTPFYYLKDGRYVVFPGETINLTDYLPSLTHHARFIVTCLNPETNQITVVSGEESVANALIQPVIPDVPDGLIPSGIVRVKYGDVEIKEAQITDARTFLSKSGESTITHNFTATTDPSSVTGYSEGSLWYNTVTQDLFVCTGTAWLKITSAGFLWPFATITVGPNGDFTGLQEAIDSIETAGIIQVSPGTYNENLTINEKTVVIAGVGADARQSDLLYQAVFINGDVTVTVDAGDSILGIYNARVDGQILSSNPFSELGNGTIKIYLFGCYVYHGIAAAVDIDGIVGLSCRNSDIRSGGATALDADTTDAAGYEVNIEQCAVTGTIALGTTAKLNIFNSTYGTITGGTVLKHDIVAGKSLLLDTLTTDDVISWDGTKWVNAAIVTEDTYVWPGPGEIMIGTTKYASIAAAIAAVPYPGGAVIKLGEGVYVESNLQVPRYTSIVGTDRGKTIIKGTNAAHTAVISDMLYKSRLQNLTVRQAVSNNTSTERFCINIQDPGEDETDVELENVDLIVSELSGEGAENYTLFKAAGTTAIIRISNSRIFGYNESGSSLYGIKAAGAQIKLTSVDILLDYAGINVGISASGYGTVTVVGGSILLTESTSSGTLFVVADNARINVAAALITLTKVSGNLYIYSGPADACGGMVYDEYGRTWTGKSFPTADISTGLPIEVIDTDGTLAANSDKNLATQKATKTYVDAHAGAPTDAQYVTLATSAGLSAERTLAVTAPITKTDGGANNPVTLAIDAASESAKGAIEIATQGETDTGTDDTRAITPLKLATYVSDYLVGFAEVRAKMSGTPSLADSTATLFIFDTQVTLEGSAIRWDNSNASTTGTGAITGGGTTLTGTGTAFLSEFVAGQAIKLSGGTGVTEFNTVVSVASNTSLTVARGWNTTGTGKTIGYTSQVMVIQEDGYYLVDGTIEWASHATGRRELMVIKNAVNSTTGGTWMSGDTRPAVNGNVTEQTLSQIDFYSQYDLIVLRGYQTSTTTLSYTADRVRLGVTKVQQSTQYSLAVTAPDTDIVQVNLVKNFPSLEFADDTQPEWWEESGSGTLTEVDAAGESIPEKNKRVLKFVSSVAGGGVDYAYQRFVHADEPLLDSSVTVISAAAEVYVVTAGTLTMELYDVGGSASLGTATTTTTGGWVKLQILNKTIGTTSTDLRFKHSANSATFYVAKPTVNVGPVPINWKPRGLKMVDVGASAILSNVDPAGGTWTDVDVSAVTSNLAVLLEVVIHYLNSTTAAIKVYFRRNGSTVGNTNVSEVIRNLAASTNYSIGITTIMLDDSQIFEYDSSGAAGDAESLYSSIKKFWEWE